MIHKFKHYFPVYEKHFRKYVNQSIVFWEIGVYQGGSLQMWKRYFGPFARIIGIDINPECLRHADEQITVCIGDQSDPEFLQSIINRYGYPDVVLDDGSHVMKHICATFEFLYERVNRNGCYMVEDLHTAYMESYGGGLHKEGSFLEECKLLIDMINARYNDLPNDFADSTFSMSFYDSIVAFDKALWLYPVKPLMTSEALNMVRKAAGRAIAILGLGTLGFEILLNSGLGERICGFIVADADTYPEGVNIGSKHFDVFSIEKALDRLTFDTIIMASVSEYGEDIYDNLRTTGFKNEIILF